MKIEVYREDDGLNGGKEIWVKVMSNEVLDWPTIKGHLDPETAGELAGYSLGNFYPHMVTPEEREDHGYLMEEWYVWTAK